MLGEQKNLAVVLQRMDVAENTMEYTTSESNVESTAVAADAAAAIVVDEKITIGQQNENRAIATENSPVFDGRGTFAVADAVDCVQTSSGKFFVKEIRDYGNGGSADVVEADYVDSASGFFSVEEFHHRKNDGELIFFFCFEFWYLRIFFNS